MEKRLEEAYRNRDRRKKKLRSLKNRYFAIIYAMATDGRPAKEIHKALYKETVRVAGDDPEKPLLAMALKLANRALRARIQPGMEPAAAVFDLIHKSHADEAARKIINRSVRVRCDRDKETAVRDYVEESRRDGRWFYLASEHGDCAEDHKAWQGKMYVDRDAPAEAMDYARSRGMRTMQWVMGDPVWFITRPNCRHYFVSLGLDEAKKPLKKLRKKHHTVSREGDRRFQTPVTAAIEEYEDRVRMLRGLLREKRCEKLEKELEKAEMLLKKWKKEL